MSVYAAGQSAGKPFETGTMRSLVVSAETLSKIFGYEGEDVTYTAVVTDDLGAAIPATFVVDLEINSTKVITGQALSADVYNPNGGLLTLPWKVPAAVGPFTVKLVWAEQLI